MAQHDTISEVSQAPVYTLYVGLDSHKVAMVVAYVANPHPAAEGVPRASVETQPQCGVTLDSVQRLVEGDSSRDRGRHQTEARKGGANPRIAAGSTVESRSEA